MAEGVARLEQQVVDTVCWSRADALAPVASATRPRISADALELECRPSDIRRAVESDLVPRLLNGHDDAEGQRGRAAPRNPFGHDDILRFAGILLRPGAERSAEGHLREIREGGITIEDIYLKLFQPVARHIGELWEADLCSFVDVTLALSTMQTLMRTFGPTFHRDGRLADASRQALLVPAHGDQHTFGLWMVAEFFRRAGWNVWVESFASYEALSETVRDTWFTVVGFSESCDGRLHDLAEEIRVARDHSRNRDLGVLVGGSYFIDNPLHAGRVGADAVGIDAQGALAQAEGFAARGISP